MKSILPMAVYQCGELFCMKVFVVSIKYEHSVCPYCGSVSWSFLHDGVLVPISMKNIRKEDGNHGTCITAGQA